MRIFKNRYFARWAAKENLVNRVLIAAIHDMNKGLFDANLGGSVYKKRISTRGRGKRGAFRTLLVFKQGDRAFFIYGFAKNQRSNINSRELKALKRLANEYLEYSESELSKAIKTGELSEVYISD